MKKYYLVNYETIEEAHFNNDNEAFTEVQKRNRYDRNANWKAYTEQGDVLYGVIICQ